MIDVLDGAFGLFGLLDLVEFRRNQNLEKALPELQSDIEFLEKELARTHTLLSEFYEALRQGRGVPAELLSQIEKQLARPELLKAEAETLVRQINSILANADDLGALRLLRQQTGAVWDDIHEAIGAWPGTSELQKRASVMRLLRKKETVR